MRLFILIALLAASTLDARAAEITINLPEADELTAERTHIIYDCNGREMAVEYVNAGPVSLAVFAHEGEPVVASNVISASGARYAGGLLVWWTKGAEASLYDVTKGENAAPIVECVERR